MSGNNFEEKPPRCAECSDNNVQGSHTICVYYTERIFKDFSCIISQKFKDLP